MQSAQCYDINNLIASIGVSHSSPTKKVVHRKSMRLSTHYEIAKPRLSGHHACVGTCHRPMRVALIMMVINKLIAIH